MPIISTDEDPSLQETDFNLFCFVLNHENRHEKAPLSGKFPPSN